MRLEHLLSREVCYAKFIVSIFNFFLLKEKEEWENSPVAQLVRALH